MSYRELLKQELPKAQDFFIDKYDNRIINTLDDPQGCGKGCFGKDNKDAYESYFNRIRYSLNRKHNKELC